MAPIFLDGSYQICYHFISRMNTLKYRSHIAEYHYLDNTFYENHP